MNINTTVGVAAGVAVNDDKTAAVAAPAAPAAVAVAGKRKPATTRTVVAGNKSGKKERGGFSTAFRGIVLLVGG